MIQVRTSRINEESIAFLARQATEYTKQGLLPLGIALGICAISAPWILHFIEESFYASKTPPNLNNQKFSVPASSSITKIAFPLAPRNLPAISKAILPTSTKISPAFDSLIKQSYLAPIIRRGGPLGLLYQFSEGHYRLFNPVFIPSLNQIKPEILQSIRLTETFASRLQPISNVSLPIRGISNGANNCYMISALQTLVNSQNFIQTLEKLRKNEEKLATLTKEQKELLDLLNSFITTYKSSGNLHKIMIQIRSKIHELYPDDYLDSEAQYDSIEVVQKILDILQMNEFQLRKQIIFNSSSRFSQPEPSRFLSLEITRKASLKDSLDAFFSEERGEGMLETEPDRREKFSQKYFLEGSLPQEITLQVKRYEYGNVGKKINTKLQVDEVLDLAPYVREVNLGEETRYRLKSVIHHRGKSLQSGHYVASIRRGDQWYLYNDDRVTEIKDRDFGDGYGFVYEKMPVLPMQEVD